ncbi:MAG: hypothetical protein JWL60_682 [Gemmatimonadetes bacterium]|jgi:hypothetical protein|nr:hypothetical protein [Gemmatimonadota bacterium]
MLEAPRTVGLWWNDLRLTWRSLRRSPVYTAALVASPGFGVFLGVGVFAVARALAFPDSP